MSEEELKEWKEEIKQQRIEAQGEISQFVEGALLLFLIDKILEQQKEIEQLKHLKGFITYDNNGNVKILKLTDYISKDKLRAKIKELKAIGKYQLDHKDKYLEQESIDLLEELLKEGVKDE